MQRYFMEAVGIRPLLSENASLPFFDYFLVNPSFLIPTAELLQS
jgi:hypothetical protein